MRPPGRVDVEDVEEASLTVGGHFLAAADLLINVWARLEHCGAGSLIVTLKKGENQTSLKLLKYAYFRLNEYETAFHIWNELTQQKLTGGSLDLDRTTSRHNNHGVTHA